jgi:cytochrome P450
MTSSVAEQLGIDLNAEEFWSLGQEARAAAFATLRKEAPLARYTEPELPFLPSSGGEYVAVTRHADIDHISSNPELFCSGHGAVSIVDLPQEMHEFFGSMISMDNPRHAKIRRIVSTAFTPRMLEDLLDNVQGITTDLVTNAKAHAAQNNGEFDLVQHIAAPLPLTIICQMMGIPESEYAMVLQQSNIILSGGDPEFMPSPEEAITQVLTAGGMLADLMTKLAEERKGSPTNDLTSNLVNANVDGETLTFQEIASFFILLVAAGNETTRTAITHGVYQLDRNPDQKKAWMADDDLTKTAVEEIVRYASPVTWMRRTATQPVTVGGENFDEGAKFVLFYNSGNRDESVFADPDRFDLSRSPNPHVGFGARGPHFCLGANLARREIAVAFKTMFDQMPDLSVVGEPDRLWSSFINGIKRMTVKVN